MLEIFLTIKDALPFLVKGSLATVIIVIGAMGLGLVLGLCMAAGMVYGNRLFKTVCGLYIWFFQGVPALVLLFLFYFGLFNYLGFNFGAVTVATIVLGLITAAYQANIFRGAMLSVPQGQFRAANALGMSNVQVILFIILPQVLRVSIPAWSNEFSIVLKDSALAFVIGAPEIMARTQFVASRTYQHLPLYITAGLIYFLLTWTGLKGLRKLENRVRVPGYSHQEM
ncbi:MAG: amino acid ABC transporter permease [Desulfobacteraceae bacterium]